MNRCNGAVALALGLCVTGVTTRAITVHETDALPNADRTHFVDFQNLPAIHNYGSTYSQSGLVVSQVNGQVNDILTTYNMWKYHPATAPTTERSWVPNAGDYGFTKIMHENGDNFEVIGMLVGSGNYPTGLMYYELLHNGQVVQSGTIAHKWKAHYVGFSGGEFNEVRLRDGYFVDGQGNVTFGKNALAIDDIEAQCRPQHIPEAGATFALLGIALGSLFAVRRSQN